MAKTRPDGFPLTPDDREFWDKPYQFQAFPKMLYRGTTTTSGTIDTETRVVATEAEENDAKADRWFDHPQAAVDAANRSQREQQDRERHAADRHQVEVVKQAFTELAEWKALYTFQALSKTLYRGTTTPAGTVDVEQRIITAVDEQLAKADGWLDTPEAARQGAPHYGAYSVASEAELLNHQALKQAPPRASDRARKPRRRRRTIGRRRKMAPASRAAEHTNHQRVEEFLRKVFEETGTKMNREDIWRVARHSTSSEFKRWQRHDPKTRSGSEGLFSGVLEMSADKFVRLATQIRSLARS